MKLQHEIGQQMYVKSSFYISRGEDDFVGGLATIKSFEFSKTLPENDYNYAMVVFEENPYTSYNYKYLLEKQEELKAQFSDSKAHPDPDINTPWIEEGDIVNGEMYKGKPIW